jgi:hypothetical protein
VPDVQWYYAQSGRQFGPFSESEMLARISRGEIQRTDLAWFAGLPQWQPAGQIRVLFPAPVPPPLPPSYASIPYATPFNLSYPPPRDLGQDPTMRLLLPVGRSPLAIIAGYLGLFSVLLIPAPVALAVSIFAILDIKKHPKKHGMGRAIFGLVMGILGSLLLIFVLITLALGH